MSKHLIKFKYGGVEDDESIRLVFNKDRVEDRKKWMQQNQENEETPNGLELTYKQFIDKELISFTYLDLKRSIPSMVDGLKPSQRKVLHTLIRMGKQKEIKVSQLAGATSLNQAYHHGEESLVNTIVHLAQDYVGSNNVPLLMAIGQFGTRHEGGTDAANARYIHTQLRFEVLSNNAYCPIVPLVLVNGAEGIATGWATRILNHDLRKVANNVRRMIDGSVLEPMIPSFTGFTGSINKVEENVFEVRGVASLLPDERKNSAHIRCFKEYHSERNVRFTVDLKRDMAKHYMKRQNTDLIKLFKLSSNVTVNSMVLFDENGRLKKYSSTAEILWDHFKTRKRKYEERKEYETRMLEAQKKIVDNQVRFIESIMNGTIQLGRPRLEIENKLRSEGFEDDPVKKWKRETPNLSYLLDMPMSRLTLEEISRLHQRREDKAKELKATIERSWEEAWLSDLDAMEKVGPVEKVHLMDKGTHRFALVLFVDIESVPFAIETLNGVKLFDVPITVKPRNGTKQEEEYKKFIEIKRRNSRGFAQNNASPNIDESRQREHSGLLYPMMEGTLALQGLPTSFLYNDVCSPLGYTPSPPHSTGRLQPGYKIPSFSQHNTSQRLDNWHSPNSRYGGGSSNRDRRDDSRDFRSVKKTNSFYDRRDKGYDNRDNRRY
uniref:DNA topoisomerase (ATP-hydrolyzing) n=1 Tax=Heterorhabditis bacteriophora TaxID=37862 RepID=A0A1I7XGY6_HETBA